jgi:large subunit ribosomal protein L15
VDPDFLVTVGLVKKAHDPIVILGDGEIKVALSVKAHRFSASAKEKIEAAGGTVSVIPLA